jgi:hypothetical protein
MNKKHHRIYISFILIATFSFSISSMAHGGSVGRARTQCDLGPGTVAGFYHGTSKKGNGKQLLLVASCEAPRLVGLHSMERLERPKISYFIKVIHRKNILKVAAGVKIVSRVVKFTPQGFNLTSQWENLDQKFFSEKKENLYYVSEVHIGGKKVNKFRYEMGSSDAPPALSLEFEGTDEGGTQFVNKLNEIQAQYSKFESMGGTTAERPIVDPLGPVTAFAKLFLERDLPGQDLVFFYKPYPQKNSEHHFYKALKPLTYEFIEPDLKNLAGKYTVEILQRRDDTPANTFRIDMYPVERGKYYQVLQSDITWVSVEASGNQTRETLQNAVKAIQLKLDGTLINLKIF